MDLLIGARIDAHLDALEGLAPAGDVTELVDGLMPVMRFMTRERYIVDVILRRSGAAAVKEIGPIARTFAGFIDLLSVRMAGGPFRRDVSPEMLAAGVQAFAVQVMALRFCALHATDGLRDPLAAYLNAWLMPPA